MNGRCMIAVVLSLMLLLNAATAQVPSEIMSPIVGTPKAEDFTLPDPSGQEHRLSDYRGKVVMVNFWATWCAPCRKEMPAMDRLYRNIHEEGLEILAIHAGPGGEAMHEFLAQIPVSFPILVDADLALGGWQVPALPTTIFVDREGRMIYSALGAREWDSEAMKSFLREILIR